ncbi:MAG: hypothetical protein NTV63_04870 [Candidatus Woesearchaeota archaeon]|nr:hypothetical protein [Candidatus Woesearchaeota archaeon]
MSDEFKLTGENILDFIKRKENIPVLEHLLVQYSYEIEKIGKINHDSKKIDGKKALESILSDSKSAVDSFLKTDEKMPDTSFYSIFRDVDRYKLSILGLYSAGSFGAGASLFEILSGNIGAISIPALFLSAGMISFASGYRNQLSSDNTFNARNSKITLHRANEVDTALYFAHEYTHYLQQKSGIMGKFSGGLYFFEEGHALGVQREIGKQYSEKTGNKEYVRRNSDCTLGELKSVYFWMCRELNENRTKFSYLMPTSNEREEFSLMMDLGTPSNHATGNAFFLIKELTHGIGIYKNAIHGNFDFLK